MTALLACISHLTIGTPQARDRRFLRLDASHFVDRSTLWRSLLLITSNPYPRTAPTFILTHTQRKYHRLQLRSRTRPSVANETQEIAVQERTLPNGSPRSWYIARGQGELRNLLLVVVVRFVPSRCLRRRKRELCRWTAAWRWAETNTVRSAIGVGFAFRIGLPASIDARSVHGRL